MVVHIYFGFLVLIFTTVEHWQEEHKLLFILYECKLLFFIYFKYIIDMGKGKVVFTRGYSCIVLYVEDLKEKDE